MIRNVLCGGAVVRFASVAFACVVALACGGCGGGPAGPGSGQEDAGSGPGGGGGGGPTLTDDELETREGCPGVYNPDQLLDYHLAMAPGDFEALLADQTNSMYFAAELRCGDESPIANADSLLFKDNNYYFYDWAGTRAYLPWDLDTVMKETFDVFSGGGGGANQYTTVLFSSWEGDYAAILDELLSVSLTLAVIEGELDRAVAVAGEGFASDPHVSGTLAGAADSLRTYWTQRHAAVRAQVDGR